MPSTFINPVVNPDSSLGMRPFDDAEPVRLWSDRSEADVEVIIRAVYRQVLGNAHVMESERLTVQESQLKQGEVSVREFVRLVAKSDLYRSRFFENCPRNRAIEINFKHLLGRAPESYEEMVAHGQLLDQSGYEAEIDSYLDSTEYEQMFGEDTVPFYQGHKTQPGRKMVGFTHLFSLLRGASSSDKDTMSNNRSRLNGSIMGNRPSSISPVKGAPNPWQTPASAFMGIANGKSTKTHQPLSVGLGNQGVGTDRQDQFYHAYQAFKDTAPVELWPGFLAVEAEVVIRAVYCQVLGNAHVMESERLTVPESQLKCGDISVREFIRKVAKSSLYQSRFFDNCYRYRSIELNFKHLLGRAPDNFDEMRAHSKILDEHGYEADIDSYLDSKEYYQAFGENIVPYYRGIRTQAGQSMLGFTNMFQLLRSASSSDKDLATNQHPRLTRSLIENAPYGIRKPSDASAILAQLFQTVSPLPSDAVTPTLSDSPAPTVQDVPLQQKVQEQQAQIVSLQAQLAELRPLANVGAAIISQSRFGGGVSDVVSLSSSGGTRTVSFDPLQRQCDEQAAQIQILTEQLAEARSLSAISDYKLNKWRSRSFNR